jgi:hypothetical protein
MTKIAIHIDTEDSRSFDDAQSRRPRSANKVGLLSTIPISPAQFAGFANGFGSPSSSIPKADNLTYAPGAIRQGKNTLKNFPHNCNVLAVTGGLAAYTAIFAETDNPPFVCLVGQVPDLHTLGNCSGGISTDGWRSNKAKRDYLIAKGYNANDIGLYYNPNSGVATDEVADWKTFNPPTTVKAFSGAGGDSTTPTNDDSKFAVDFAGGLFAGLTAIVVSADPFFQASMEKLISAANSWNGYVCYPLQDYKNLNGTQPKANKATLHGPDLTVAYTVLGALAQGAADNPHQGFFIASNLINDIV